MADRHQMDTKAALPHPMFRAGGAFVIVGLVAPHELCLKLVTHTPLRQLALRPILTAMLARTRHGAT